jgi:AraC-like DNA-binding protein
VLAAWELEAYFPMSLAKIGGKNNQKRYLKSCADPPDRSTQLNERFHRYETSMISLQTYIPERIGHIVKSFWFLEVSPSHPVYEEEIIPDGHHELIFHLKPGGAKRRSANEWIEEPASFVAAQTLQCYALQLSPGSRLFGIRFYPHTLFPLLGIPMAALTDRISALNDVMDDRSFRNALSDDPQVTFANFERLLLEKIKHAVEPYGGYRYVHGAVSEIIRHRGDVTVDHLVATTGISVKHLNTLFQRYVGLNPKTVCGILKINHFISYRYAHPGKNFTTCCYDTGYYDQSHLIKSFQRFTNRSPRQYFSESGFINERFTQL